MAFARGSEGPGRHGTSTPRRRVVVLAAVILAVVHATLAWTATRETCTTYDEIGHVTAGASYVLTGDHRLHPENGLLPQMLQGLAALATGARFPDRSDAAWEGSDVWTLGHRFFHESGNDRRVLLASARGVVALLAGALVLGVFFWSRRLFGDGGGLVSATTACLSPTLLAHGGLATSDLFGAATMFAATWALDGLCRRVTPGRMIMASVLFAAALLSKASALLLVPLGLALCVAALLREQPLVLAWGGRTRALEGRGPRAAAWLLAAFALGILVAGWLWAAYGFRYAITAPGSSATLYFGGWPHVEVVGGPAIGLVTWMRDVSLLPEAWLYGLGFVLAHAAGRAAFLDGAYDPMGFPDFFPRAFVYKTPTAVLALCALALLVSLAASWRGDGARAAGKRLLASVVRALPLLLLVALVGAAATGSRLNIGHRHLLPLYPALFVLCGAAVGPRLWPNVRFVAAGLLLGWLIAQSATTWPHSLAFFSSVAGGPSQGYRHLVDSSLDWGQDLPRLARELSELQAGTDPPERVYLSYFGKGSPDAEGIEAVHLPFVPDTLRRYETYPLQAGLYCIGATMLQLVYLPVSVPWTTGDEQAWSAVRAEIEALEASQDDPEANAAFLTRHTTDEWNRLVQEYDTLRFARLCAWLRQREPDRQVGYSINLYRLSDADVREAVFGPPAELVDARAAGAVPGPGR